MAGFDAENADIKDGVQEIGLICVRVFFKKKTLPYLSFSFEGKVANQNPEN